MSSQPKPLFALCEEWREQDHGEEYVKDLIAALKAWDAHIENDDGKEIYIEPDKFVREKILGLPKQIGQIYERGDEP